jgi:uncharacterized membrane protein
MKKHITTWLAIFISLLPIVYLAIIWKTLPQMVPVHFNSKMEPDRMGDKGELWIACGVLAGVSLAVYFLFQNIHRIDPKRKGRKPSANFIKLGFGIVVFIAAINFLLIQMSRQIMAIQNLLFPLLGLLFAFIGNYMINIKPNYFAGIRLPWTLSDDENWRKTHQLGGKLWFAGGLLIAIVCFFLPTETAFIFFLIVMVIIIIIPVVYSYRFFKKHSSL